MLIGSDESHILACPQPWAKGAEVLCFSVTVTVVSEARGIPFISQLAELFFFFFNSELMLILSQAFPASVQTILCFPRSRQHGDFYCF